MSNDTGQIDGRTRVNVHIRRPNDLYFGSWGQERSREGEREGEEGREKLMRSEMRFLALYLITCNLNMFDDV